MLFRLLEQRLAEGAIVSVHVGIVPCLLELVNLGPAHANVLSDLHGEILLILCSFLVGLVLIKSLMKVSLLFEVLLSGISGFRAKIAVV